MKPKLFLKMSEEFSKDFSSLMATAIMQKTLDSLKEASGTGTFKFVISTDDEDRQGEKVNQAGLDFGNYMKNPVVLWSHKYDEPPVGVTTRIYKEGGKTIAEGKWASTALAQELRKLYDEGIINACSIGFIPKELDADGNTQKGEVLEYSIVSVPANPFALSQRMVQERKIDLNMLVAKGIEFKIETEIKTTAPVIKSDAVVGDSCQLDDGTAGTFADDGNGGLVCQPIKDAGVNGGEVTTTTLAAKPTKDDEAPNSPTAESSLKDSLVGEVDRHAGASTKSIEGLCKAIEGLHAEKKASDDGKMPAELTKALEEFKTAMVNEHTTHREKCMKALEEYGNTEKTLKATVADELAESQEKQAKFQKVNKVWDVFDAFICAYLDDGTPVADFEKLLDEAIVLMKDQTKSISGLLKKFFVEGSRKKFSKTNLETLKGALAEFEKAVASHDDAQSSMADVHKSHKAVHAALKGLVSEPKDGNDGGDDDSKSAPKKAVETIVEPSEPKVDKTLTASEDEKALETFLLNRDLLKSLNKGITDALQKHNEALGKDRPASRK